MRINYHEMSGVKVFIVILVSLVPALASGQGLFATDSILDLKISGDLKPLMNDRGETPADHTETLYWSEGGTEHSLSVLMRTRGHFRKTMGECDYPPLFIQFRPSDTLAHSIFKGQRKTKLVVPCRDAEYVVREWLVYRIHALTTPMGFRSRLVRLTLSDTRNGKATTTYAMLLEEEGQMAARNDMMSVSRDIAPEKCNQDAFLEMAIFEYFIGNTDWSVQYGQNVKLIAKDSMAVPVTVPYDFDQCGFVNAPYARPAEELQLSNVQVRRFRGYCVPDVHAFDVSIGKLIGLRPEIEKLIADAPVLTQKSKAQASKFLSGFYDMMSDPKRRQRELAFPCDPRNPGVNVVIKGLRTN